jgi:hypothetical protein
VPLQFFSGSVVYPQPQAPIVFLLFRFIASLE